MNVYTCLNYLPSSCTWSLEQNLTSPKNSNSPTGIVYQLNLNLTSHNSERKNIYFKYLILFLSPPAQWHRFTLLHDLIPVCITVKLPGSKTTPPGPTFSKCWHWVKHLAITRKFSLTAYCSFWSQLQNLTHRLICGKTADQANKKRRCFIGKAHTCNTGKTKSSSTSFLQDLLVSVEFPEQLLSSLLPFLFKSMITGVSKQEAPLKPATYISKLLEDAKLNITITDTSWDSLCWYTVCFVLEHLLPHFHAVICLHSSMHRKLDVLL